MSADSDATLLLRMARGDNAAAIALHERIGPRLLAYARAWVRDDALAEDAVQQAWLRAISRPTAELERVRDAMGWMVHLTRTLALNLTRTRARSAARERLRLASDLTPAPAPLGESHLTLLSAVQQLSDDHREMILLRHVAGLTFDQVALALDENRSTVASRYRAAVQRLRETLATSPAPSTPASLRPQEAAHA